MAHDIQSIIIVYFYPSLALYSNKSMSHTIPLSLATLKSHSIFIPPISTSSPPEDEWELLDRPSADEPMSQKHNRMVLRDKDLIVAMGSEVRMTSLNASDGSWKVEDGLVGSYRVGGHRCLVQFLSLS